MNSYQREHDTAVGSDTRGRDILVMVLAVFLAVVSYAGTLTHELVWDDVEVLNYVDTVVKEGGVSALVTSQFATHIEEGYVSGYYRPVAVVSLWVDKIISGFFPSFYHLTNVGLHALNTVLVFILLRLLCAPVAAEAGTLIFAVHPVHTESVSFVSGRTDLWAAFFVLLAVIAWLREQKGLSASPGLDRFRSFAAFFMACLSKEVAFILPVVLLAWDAAAPGPGKPGAEGWWSRNRRWVMGWAAVMACVLLLRFVVFGGHLGLVQVRGGEAGPGENPFDLVQIGQMLLVYLKLLVIPWPLKVYYGPGDLQAGFTAILGTALLLCLAAYAWYRFGRGNALRALAWIALFLVPVLGVGFRGGALVAERFLYLPSVGLSLLAGMLAAGLAVDRRALYSGIGLLVALLTFGSVKQSAVWRNEITLFTRLVTDSPLSHGGHYNLANAYAARGMQPEAVESYRQAIAIHPRHYRAWFNLGNALSALGRDREAVRAYRKVLDIKPDHVAGYINLGVALVDIMEPGEAAAVYRDGIRHAPGDVRLHLGLILSYVKAGNRGAALEHHRRLLRENPALAGIIGRVLFEDEGQKKGILSEGP